jgi:hypothetical protein
VDPERAKIADKMEAAGYLPHLRQIIASCTKPIWWSRSSSVIGDAILHSGTFCAINTGEVSFGVTAGHVFETYLSQKRQFDDIECQVGNVRIDLEDFLFDHNTNLDLATFGISPFLLTATGISTHAPITWPPADLEEKEIVGLGGYPGMFRQEAPRLARFDFASFFAPVAQSSKDHLAFQLNLADSYWPDNSGGIPAGSELGGMSGGPVFRYRPKPVEFLELAGFIYEASSVYELVFARHASCITGSGEIIGDA